MSSFLCAFEHYFNLESLIVDRLRPRNLNVDAMLPLNGVHLFVCVYM